MALAAEIPIGAAGRHGARWRPISGYQGLDARLRPDRPRSAAARATCRPAPPMSSNQFFVDGTRALRSDAMRPASRWTLCSIRGPCRSQVGGSTERRRKRRRQAGQFGCSHRVAPLCPVIIRNSPCAAAASGQKATREFLWLRHHALACRWRMSINGGTVTATVHVRRTAFVIIRLRDLSHCSRRTRSIRDLSDGLHHAPLVRCAQVRSSDSRSHCIAST
jgi:hypothetical protein